MGETDNFLLQVSDVRKFFSVGKGMLPKKHRDWVKAVDGVSFTLRKKETLGILGESGCGKTTLARTILLLERPSSGIVRFRGQDIYTLKGQGVKAYRRAVQAVFQNPYLSLDPRMRVQDIVAEPLEVGKVIPREAIRARVEECLELVGLDRSMGLRFPHELSGGERQRVAIAEALAPCPELVVLDEPVSSLDVSIQTQVIKLLLELKETLSLSYLLISHDLATIWEVAGTAATMYLGRFVEVQEPLEMCNHPMHPYTEALLAATVRFEPHEAPDDKVMIGEPPNAIRIPPGCRFHPRCRYAIARCLREEPVLKMIAPKRYVACHLRESC